MRRRRGLRLAVGSIALVVAAIAAWLWLPWRHVAGLTVEAVRVLQADEPDGGRTTPGPATARRIAVTFATFDDLAATRRRLGVGFIAARLFACDTPARGAREVVTQRAEYLGDHRRVTPLPPVRGRARYLAVFDDRLTQTIDHGFRTTPALTAGPLCFTLEGGSLGYGKVSAAVIRLPPLR